MVMDLLKTDDTNSNNRLSRLRAGVLGANDGIVSTSAVLMGIAGASGDTGLIFTSGLAALVAGALSMAVGEYISVSSQGDAEAAFVEKERRQLKEKPKEQLISLATAYVKLGLSKPTALQVARELSSKDALKAHLNIKYGIDEADLSSPGQAAAASLAAFTAGGLLPFLVAVLTPSSLREIAIVGSVVTALIFTGYISAKAGNASVGRATVRVVLGGVVAMGITYAIGALFGTAIS